MNATPVAQDKRARQREILEVVVEDVIRTQDELVECLAQRGVEVTQSTVSRDIRELGLVRVPQPQGGFRYAPPNRVRGHDRERQIGMLREFVRVVDGSGTTAVIKTGAGNAHPVGLALDRLELDSVVGTVAGDDTIFVLLREGEDWRDFRRWLLETIR